MGRIINSVNEIHHKKNIAIGKKMWYLFCVKQSGYVFSTLQQPKQSKSEVNDHEEIV
jgi:hypothetical protein